MLIFYDFIPCRLFSCIIRRMDQAQGLRSNKELESVEDQQLLPFLLILFLKKSIQNSRLESSLKIEIES